MKTLFERMSESAKAKAPLASYEQFYNHAGMMLDAQRAQFHRLPADTRQALMDEHHRRTQECARAWAEDGEVIDHHDKRFSPQSTGERG